MRILVFCKPTEKPQAQLIAHRKVHNSAAPALPQQPTKIKNKQWTNRPQKQKTIKTKKTKKKKRNFSTNL
jgi:hypothetical protein